MLQGLARDSLALEQGNPAHLYGGWASATPKALIYSQTEPSTFQELGGEWWAMLLLGAAQGTCQILSLSHAVA